MKCPEAGILQSYLDGELDLLEKKKAEKHLSECAGCKAKLEELKKADDFTFEKMSYYMKQMDEAAGIEIKPFRGNFCKETKRVDRGGIYSFMMKYKKFAAIVCLGLAVTACVTIRPVRAFISEALNIFRVESVKGIHISLKDIEEVRNKLSAGEGVIDLEQMGKIELEGMKEETAAIGEIRAMEDFKVILPHGDEGEYTSIRTVQPGTVKFTLNAQYVNELLKSLGAAHLLPENIDGKTFTAEFEKQVFLKYQLGEKVYRIEEIKAPQIIVPEDVDAEKLYRFILEMPILPENMKQQLKAVKEWRSTIYYPILESRTESVDINGAEGFVSEKKEGAGSVIAWSRDGVIYIIGSNTEKDDIIAFAKSLR